MHDDNVSRVYIANEMQLCQCAAKKNICLRFLGMITVFVQFVFSICQLKKRQRAANSASFFFFSLNAKFPLYFLGFTISTYLQNKLQSVV